MFSLFLLLSLLNFLRTNSNRPITPWSLSGLKQKLEDTDIRIENNRFFESRSFKTPIASDSKEEETQRNEVLNFPPPIPSAKSGNVTPGPWTKNHKNYEIPLENTKNNIENKNTKEIPKNNYTQGASPHTTPSRPEPEDPQNKNQLTQLKKEDKPRAALSKKYEPRESKHSYRLKDKRMAMFNLVSTNETRKNFKVHTGTENSYKKQNSIISKSKRSSKVYFRGDKLELSFKRFPENNKGNDRLVGCDQSRHDYERIEPEMNRESRGVGFDKIGNSKTPFVQPYYNKKEFFNLSPNMAKKLRTSKRLYLNIPKQKINTLARLIKKNDYSRKLKSILIDCSEKDGVHDKWKHFRRRCKDTEHDIKKKISFYMEELESFYLDLRNVLEKKTFVILLKGESSKLTFKKKDDLLNSKNQDLLRHESYSYNLSDSKLIAEHEEIKKFLFKNAPIPNEHGGNSVGASEEDDNDWETDYGNLSTDIPMVLIVKNWIFSIFALCFLRSTGLHQICNNNNFRDVLFMDSPNIWVKPSVLGDSRAFKSTISFLLDKSDRLHRIKDEIQNAELRRIRLGEPLFNKEKHVSITSCNLSIKDNLANLRERVIKRFVLKKVSTLNRIFFAEKEKVFSIIPSGLEYVKKVEKIINTLINIWIEKALFVAEKMTGLDLVSKKETKSCLSCFSSIDFIGERKFQYEETFFDRFRFKRLVKKVKVEVLGLNNS